MGKPEMVLYILAQVYVNSRQFLFDVCLIIIHTYLISALQNINPSFGAATDHIFLLHCHPSRHPLAGTSGGKLRNLVKLVNLEKLTYTLSLPF